MRLVVIKVMSLSPLHLLRIVLDLVLKAGASLVQQVLFVSPGSFLLCLDHPCHNEIPGLPAWLLFVLVFSQHHSPLRGLSAFPLPRYLWCHLSSCTLDLDFPPPLFFCQYLSPIAVSTTDAVASAATLRDTFSTISPISRPHHLLPLLLLSCSGVKLV